MKQLILVLTFALTINVNAGVLIDDFSTGELVNTVFSDKQTEYQVGDMKGSNRMLSLRISANEDNQNTQIEIKNKLVASFGYNTRGVLYVNYGSSKNGLAPMKLDLLHGNGCEVGCKTLNIEFEAKSSKSGIYVSLFTNSDRAVWRDHIGAHTGRITIPLADLEVIGSNFTLEQVDYIRFQFDSRTITGHNFAVTKIWIE